LPFKNNQAGELTVGHKDFVVFPMVSDLWEFRMKSAILGGQGMIDAAGQNSSNLDMLQPSVRWPGDHCSILCILEGDTAETNQRKMSAAEPADGACPAEEVSKPELANVLKSF
jgi:hypothetical protein